MSDFETCFPPEEDVIYGTGEWIHVYHLALRLSRAEEQGLKFNRQSTRCSKD